MPTFSTLSVWFNKIFFDFLLFSYGKLKNSKYSIIYYFSCQKETHKQFYSCSQDLRTFTFLQNASEQSWFFYHHFKKKIQIICFIASRYIFYYSNYITTLTRSKKHFVFIFARLNPSFCQLAWIFSFNFFIINSCPQQCTIRNDDICCASK